MRKACRLSGIGRSKLYQLIKAGEIETIKLGYMTLIPTGSLAALLETGKMAGKSERNAANAAGRSTENR